MQLCVSASGCCFLQCLYAGPHSVLAAPAVFPELFAGEQGCTLIWITCIYLFKCPPQAVSGKGRAHASIASLMHIWLPYHEAGSKLQWALMFSRKWAETSLNQCGFFFFQWNSRIHCSVSSVVWVLQIGCLNTAVGNTALWSLTFFFLFNLRKDSGRIEEHIWDVSIMIWAHVLHQNLLCAYLNLLLRTQF